MNIMSIGISFIEILAILLIYNILINNNVFKGISRIGILSIITSFIYSLFTIVNDTDTLIILIGVLFLNSIVISKFEEKDTIVTFIELVVSTLLVLGFELIISFIVYVTMGDDNLSPTVYLILVTCIMSILIYLLNTNKFIKIGHEIEIKNKWKIFNPEEHRFLNVQKDRRGYIIRNTENIIYKGKKINTDYFIPRNGDIFINQNYIFCCLKNNLFFEKIKNTTSQEHVKFINNTSVENNIKNQSNLNKVNNPNKNYISNNKPAILMSNVTRYDKKKKWYRLKDVNLKINSGRLVAIMGVSGAGKSTLFDAILKRLKLDSGEIIIDGNELGHVPQFSVLRKGNTVQEVMEFYASKKLKGYTKQQKMQKIDSLLEKLNLSLFKQSLVGRLSGGQSRRLDIAVQLLNEPKVILMDEPDSGLDVKSCRELYEILSRLVSEKNSTILVITHNTHMACKYPYIDDLLFMASQGRICFYGEKDKALEYFNISDLDDIYNAVENNQDYFVQKYNNLLNRRV